MVEQTIRNRQVASSTLALGSTFLNFPKFGASIENSQVAMIREETMALFAGRLTNHAELHHVLQSLRHSGRREGELLGRRRDRDNRSALKVLVNAQNGCSGAAKLLDLPAIFFDACEYLLRRIGCLLSGFFHTC